MHLKHNSFELNLQENLKSKFICTQEEGFMKPIN